MREQEHIANRGLVGEQHDHAVDADADATRRGHAVFERTDVVGVVFHGLFVAVALGFHLGGEAALLVDRVVEFGEGVGVFVAGDHELEAVGEARVARLALGERRDLDRVVAHEGGVHDLLLAELVVEGEQELARAPILLPFELVGVEQGAQVRNGRVHVDVLAHMGAHHFRKRDALPGAGQVDRLALVGDDLGIAHHVQAGLDEAFGQLLHAVDVAEGLVGLDGGEFGIVGVVHALVAENAADFVDAVEPAHQAALQVQLGGDAQVAFLVERVEVGDEGLGVGAAHDLLQDRGLDFQEVEAVHVGAAGGDDLRAVDEDLLDVGVHHEVNVALAIAGLLVGKAVELFGQGADRLRQKGEAVDGDGKLAALGTHHRALHADPVAHVEILHLGEGRIAQGVHPAEELDVAHALAQDHEHDLALVADGDDAAGSLHAIVGAGAVFKVGVVALERVDMLVVIEAHAVGELAGSEQRLSLGKAHLARVVFDFGNVGAVGAVLVAHGSSFLVRASAVEMQNSGPLGAAAR